MKTSNFINAIPKKLFLLLISISLLSLYSCKKEDKINPSKNKAGIETKYLIFNSDSLQVFGRILDDPSDRYLYPNTPYEVLEGQRILFFRRYPANTVYFSVAADIGKCNYFSSDNQNHYQLTNEYIIVVK